MIWKVAKHALHEFINSRLNLALLPFRVSKKCQRDFSTTLHWTRRVPMCRTLTAPVSNAPSHLPPSFISFSYSPALPLVRPLAVTFSPTPMLLSTSFAIQCTFTMWWRGTPPRWRQADGDADIGLEQAAIAKGSTPTPRLSCLSVPKRAWGYLSVLERSERSFSLLEISIVHTNIC